MTTKGGHTAPLNVATSALATSVDDLGSPQLPVRSPLNGHSDIVREKPRTVFVAAQAKVGAATRQQNEPLDKELRSTRIFGGRQPRSQADSGGVQPADTGGIRPTGAVTHPVVKSQTHPPTVPPANFPPSNPPVKSPPVKTPKSDQQPVKQPVYSPPVKSGSSQSPQPVRSPPRSDPPTKSEPPKSLPPTKPSNSDGASKKASSKSD
jgi:hypothetical protein